MIQNQRELLYPNIKYICKSHRNVIAHSVQVLGHLIENMGAIWLAYVLLGEATVSMLIFFPLLLFSRLYLQPRYPSSRECDDVSANVTAKGEQLEHSLGFLEKEEVEDTV